MATLERILDSHDIDMRQMEELLLSLSPGALPPSRDGIAQALENPYFFLSILKDDERYVGMGSIFFQRNLTRWIGEVHDVVVDPREQGRGYGRIIMDGLLDTAHAFSDRHQEKVYLSLTSKPSRVAANGLYKKLGFRLVAQAADDLGTNLYVLRIDPQ